MYANIIFPIANQRPVNLIMHFGLRRPAGLQHIRFFLGHFVRVGARRHGVGRHVRNMVLDVQQEVRAIQHIIHGTRAHIEVFFFFAQFVCADFSQCELNTFDFT